MRRIMRIVPLYWLGLLGYAGIVVILYPLLGKRTDIVVSTATLLQDLFFIPRADSGGNIIHPVLQVGWTLNLEMYFYTVFTIAILASKKFAPALSAVVVLAFWCAARVFELPPLVEFFGHDYVVYFAFGVGVFYCWDRFKASASVGWLTLILGMIALAGFAATGNRIAAYVAPPLLVYGGLAIESAGFSVKSRLALLIGAASYALYLFHPFVLGLANTIWPEMRGDFLFSVTLVAVSALVAVVIHKTIELRTFRMLRSGPSSLLASESR